MNTLTMLPNSMDNCVVIAKNQTYGQGTGKNEWISPVGCAMYTLYLNLNADTFSPSRLCLLQYATALACVQAVVETPGYEVCFWRFFPAYFHFGPLSSGYSEPDWHPRFKTSKAFGSDKPVF